MSWLKGLNDAQNNLNNAINDFSKGINPISAFTNYLGEQSIKGRIKNGGYETLDPDTDFEEDGRFKTTPLEWFLNQSDDDVRRIYEKEVLSKESANAAKYGYSLKDDKGRIKRPGDLTRDKTFYSSDLVQQAIEKGIDVNSSKDTIPRVGRQLVEKGKQEELSGLGGDGKLKGPALDRALRNAKRRDQYGSLTTGEDGKPLGTAQLEQAVITEAEGARLQQQTDIEGKALYGERYGKGKGTAELASELALEQLRFKNWKTSSTAKEQNTAVFRISVISPVMPTSQIAPITAAFVESD